MNIKSFFCSDNRLTRFIDHPFIVSVSPTAVGLYYGTLDIWGDDWKWIVNHKGVHGVIFAILAIATILMLMFKGINQSLRSRIRDRQNTLTESLLSLFNKLVKKKRDRFLSKARSLSPGQDIFNHITHPDDQLGHAFDETMHFLTQGMGVKAKNIGITIIRGNPRNDEWKYIKKCDPQRQHTTAQDLMNQPSTAKHCYETGDSIFLSDIRKGVKEGVFYESSRSRRSELGSIFCKAVRITVDRCEYVYIFTIAVFGQNICSPIDEHDCRACERVFDEIADRIELELYLYSMKEYRSEYGTEKMEIKENA